MYMVARFMLPSCGGREGGREEGKEGGKEGGREGGSMKDISR